MKAVANVVARIKGVSSRLEKERLLKDNAKVPGFKEILQFIFNPYINTCIGNAKLAKVRGTMQPLLTWHAMIEHFATCQTGNSLDVQLSADFITTQETVEEKELALAIVTKTLKIGVTATTLNKVYGDDFIPVIGIMLAEKFKDFKDKVQYPVIVTEKHDGARRILVKENGVVTMFTRSGLPDTGLVDIEDEAQYLPDNSVYDGELLAIGEFDDSLALRQATNSIANSSGPRTGVKFMVFDYIPLDEFKKGWSNDTAIIRKIKLGSLFQDISINNLTSKWPEEFFKHSIPYYFRYIMSTPILGLAKNEEEVIALTEPIWNRKFEGTMIQTLGGKYRVSKSRSRDILKVKATEESVLTVIDVEEGQGNRAGIVGALVLDYKGNRLGCGSGLSLDQCKHFWHDTTLIIGKQVEIEHFGETTDSKTGLKSLNCPIFKRIVGTL